MSVTARQYTRKNKAANEGSMQRNPSPVVSPKVDSPVGHMLYLQRTIGNPVVQRLIKSGTIQAKLKIGQPNDAYEMEADRLADQVMHMTEGSLVNDQGSWSDGHPSSVQRKASCPGCEEKERIQT
ncbi:MAG: hypothetical protein GY940_07680, partial [bacterium]|nr:hypothetical protein [bacterium]